MAIDTNYLNRVLDSVSEKGLTELEIQRRYYAKLDKELKGKDRIHLMKILDKIDELELDEDFVEVLTSKSKENWMQLAKRLFTALWVFFMTWRFYISEGMPLDSYLIWVSFPFFVYLVRYLFYGEKP